MTVGSLDLHTLVLTCIPIFVAIEPFSNVTNFIALTQGFTKKQRSKVVRVSIITASLAVTAFLFVGKGVFVALEPVMNFESLIDCGHYETHSILSQRC